MMKAMKSRHDWHNDYKGYGFKQKPQSVALLAIADL
jgi:hypothetical protein